MATLGLDERMSSRGGFEPQSSDGATVVRNSSGAAVSGCLRGRVFGRVRDVEHVRARPLS
jgi:hypothetical protein